MSWIARNKVYWLTHPGRNPLHYPGTRAPHNKNRWIPHQGAKEIARRLRRRPA